MRTLFYIAIHLFVKNVDFSQERYCNYTYKVLYYKKFLRKFIKF